MAEFNLPFGVRVAGSDPIDKDRYIAADIASRNAIVTTIRAHNGLQVYVESENKLYILKGTTNSDWVEVGVGAETSISEYNFHKAQQLNLPFINVGNDSQIELLSDDSTAGGFHASIYVDDIKKFFTFTRSASAKIIVYDNLDDFSSKVVIDVSEATRNWGVENAMYSRKYGKIYFSYGDSTYAQTETLVKSIDVKTLVIKTEIKYNTGLNPGFTTVLVVGDFLYTLESNYGFKLNKFDINGIFISSIIGSSSNNIGAHGWDSDGDFIYISSLFNNNTRQNVIKYDLKTFTKVDEFSYSNGLAFTNQMTIVGQYLYLVTESNYNLMYIIDKDDLSNFSTIDLLMNNKSDDLYFNIVFDNKVYYGGANKTFGYVDINSRENVLLENPFPYSINQASVTNDMLLFNGFDIYPVSGTGFVAKGRFFKAIKSSLDKVELKTELINATQNQTSVTVSLGAILDDNQWSVEINGIGQISKTSNISSPSGNISINHTTGEITFHNALNLGDIVMIKYN